MVLRRIRLSAKRAKEPVASLAYCEDAIEEVVRRLARSSLGTASSALAARTWSFGIRGDQYHRPIITTQG